MVEDSTLTHLECSACGTTYDPSQLLNLCTVCNKPLLARYDHARAAHIFGALTGTERPPTLWRYAAILPVHRPDARISLGEGWTPLLHTPRLGARIGCPNTYIKDESSNPTGSFKARGLCLAVSRAYELGTTALAIPSAGNAAGAQCWIRAPFRSSAVDQRIAATSDVESVLPVASKTRARARASPLAHSPSRR